MLSIAGFATNPLYQEIDSADNRVIVGISPVSAGGKVRRA